MIVSTNTAAKLFEFEELMKKVNDSLNDDSKKRTEYYLKRNAQLLEDDVCGWMEFCAVNTPFEGTIYKTSSQKFPDIVAAKYFGVEVKSSKEDKWTTNGGSVNESTRVDGVERIFLTFGKLKNPIEFRTKRYEECLSGVAITHYPRYKVDMNLREGESIFEKMRTTYDELRNKSNPIGEIMRYYKSQMKSGERLWWTDDEDAIDIDEYKIRFADRLTPKEKNRITIEGMAYFPEVFGSSSKKYKEFALWMATERRIVSSSTRDFFTSDGRHDIITGTETFPNMPQIVVRLNRLKNEVREAVLNASDDTLLSNWKVRRINNDRMAQWIELVSEHSKNFKNYPAKEVLKAIF